MEININFTVRLADANGRILDVGKILQHLHGTGAKIMTAISDFAAKQNAFNDQMDAALTAINEDIADLNAKIALLQTTPGPISPEDQATLDALQARGQILADKLTAVGAQQAEAPVPPTE